MTQTGAADVDEMPVVAKRQASSGNGENEMDKHNRPATHPPQPLKFKILWGSKEPSDSVEEYDFQTKAEVAAFWRGVEDATGWNGYTLLEEGDVAVMDAEGNLVFKNYELTVIDKNGKRKARGVTTI